MAAAGGLRRSVGTTQLALGLLACGALNFEAVSADFTVDKFGVMSTLLDEVLRVPVTHSTLIQDGVESGMFYNHSTESIDIIVSPVFCVSAQDATSASVAGPRTRTRSGRKGHRA
mmetsp:Transcript_103190/g.296114  ORF Transcript_103190/g.296114 Transcript_103190/m.296114 type:complete len:115 (+) Transcript_103190:139-483(+)